MKATGLKFRPAHMAIGVSNLERSIRFYCDGLGFRQVNNFSLATAQAPALGITGEVTGRSQFIQSGNWTLELMEFTTPKPTGYPSQQANQLGPYALSLLVDDFELASAHLVECGGKLVPNSSTGGEVPNPWAVTFLHDPDGVRIELCKFAESHIEYMYQGTVR